jgi:hypothetical protein
MKRCLETKLGSRSYQGLNFPGEGITAIAAT